MKECKNKLFTIIFALTVLALFSSCEEDDYWNRGDLTFTTVNDPTPPYTSNRGEFSLTIDLYDTDIAGYNPSWDHLVDFQLYNSWLTVFSKKSFREGDEIDIYMESNGVGSYETTLFVDYEGYGEISAGYDAAFGNFMSSFINKLLHNGSARLYISGKIYDKNGYAITQSLPFDISLENSLDLRIRK